MESSYVHENSNGLAGISQTLASTGTGAATGAAIGSVIPGPGTAIGAAMGAVGGALASLFGKHHHSLNRPAFQNAPNDKVTIFKDAEFNSPMGSFKPGEFVWLGKKGRDEISSVKVPKGLKLEVWMGGKPDQIRQQPGRWGHATWLTSRRYVGDHWNDHIDTIRVSRLQPKVKNEKQEASGVGQTVSQTARSAENSQWIIPAGLGLGVLGIGGFILSNSKKSS
jgi:hypothetical protein